MGMRDLEVGKRVLKRRGDQAPEEITRRVHGTVVDKGVISICVVCECLVGNLTLCLRCRVFARL